MCSLILSFFVIAPLVILYTAGFRYDFDEKLVETTGVLSIDVETENITITVNDIEVYDSNPLRLPQLAPDLYSITIEKPGYHSWNQTVQVHSNQTTYVKDIVLLEDKLPVGLLYQSDSTTPVSLSEVGATLYYEKVEATSTKHALLDLKDQTTETVHLETADSSPVQLYWGKQNPLFSLTYPDARGVKTGFIGPDNIPASAMYRDLEVINPQWHYQDAAVYGQVGRWVEKFTPTEQALLLQVTSSQWFVDNEERVWTYNILDQTINQDELSISLPEDIFSLIDVTETTILALARDTGRVVLFERDKDSIIGQHDISASQYRYDAAEHRWYFWSDWELWQVDGTEVNLLHRSAVPIRDILFLDDADALLLVTDSTLVAFDITYYSHTPLLSGVQIDDVTVDPAARTIYYIGTDSNDVAGVYSLDY